MKINVDITAAIKPSEPEEEKPTRSRPWPTMLGEEEPVPRECILEFYDGAAVYNESGPKEFDGESGPFTDVPGWTKHDANALELLGIMTEVMDGNGTVPGFLHPKTVTRKIYCNSDSRVPESLIAEQYDISNLARFDRKPIGPCLRANRIEGNRWPIGGTLHLSPEDIGWRSDASAYNLQVQLKNSKDGEPYADVSMDMFLDSENKVLVPEYQELYVDETYESGRIKGLPVPPTVFKGSVAGSYYLKVNELSSYSYRHFLIGEDYSRDWIEGIYWTPFDLSDNENFKVTREPSYSASEVSANFVGPGKWRVYMMPRRYAFLFRARRGGIVGDMGEKEFYPLDHDTAHWFATFMSGTGEIYGDDEPYGFRRLTQPIFDERDVVAVWYGRLPNDLTLTTLPIIDTSDHDLSNQETIHATTFYYTPSEIRDFILWNAETVDEIKTHFIEAGGDPEDAAKIFSGGSNGSFHIMAASPRYGGQIYSNGIDHFFDVLHHNNEGQHINIGVSDLRNSVGLARIWTDILASGFITEYIGMSPEYTYDGADRIFSLGLCPGVEGDICAVIADSLDNLYYVWRRTAESDTEIGRMTIGTPGTVGLETHDLDTGDYSLRSGPGEFWNTGLSYVDQFTGAEGKLDRVGRPAIWAAGPPPGIVTAGMEYDVPPDGVAAYTTCGHYKSEGPGVYELPTSCFPVSGPQCLTDLA